MRTEDVEQRENGYFLVVARQSALLQLVWWKWWKWWERKSLQCVEVTWVVMCSIACLRCWIEMGGDEGGGGGRGGETSRRWEVGGGGGRWGRVM